jgi:hypothetical protein
MGLGSAFGADELRRAVLRLVTGGGGTGGGDGLGSAISISF